MYTIPESAPKSVFSGQNILVYFNTYLTETKSCLVMYKALNNTEQWKEASEITFSFRSSGNSHVAHFLSLIAKTYK